MRRAVPRAREGRSQVPLAVDVQHMKLEAHIKAEIANARPYPRHRGATRIWLSCAIKCSRHLVRRQAQGGCAPPIPPCLCLFEF